MQMMRNLPHIAGMAFNTPLLLEPAYARVFFCALAGQMGINLVRDGGDVLTLPDMQRESASFAGERATSRRPYQVVDRIAVIPVSGTLVNKGSWLNAMSGMSSYDQLTGQLKAAVSDPDVDGILLDMDTPGGMVAGAFDCADNIARMREIKPIWALANDMNCSAGQLIASAASRRLITQTACAGSIGVLMAHSNYAGKLEQDGVEITLIHSGTRKVDGNQFQALPEDVRARFQQKIDTTRMLFAQKVAQYSGMQLEDVLATEAAVYSGREAVRAGLADEVVLNTDAVALMRDALGKTSVKMINGENMTVSTGQNQVVKQEDNVQQTTTDASVQSADDQIAAAVRAENQRIMGILNCEAAQGREAQARALAETPGMTVEDAQRILAAAPQSAQSRSETALDALMAQEGAQAVSAGMTTAQDPDDLSDIPV